MSDADPAGTVGVAGVMPEIFVADTPPAVTVARDSGVSVSSLA